MADPNETGSRARQLVVGDVFFGAPTSNPCNAKEIP